MSNMNKQDEKAKRRCEEWQRLARAYNEVNEDEGDIGIYSGKPVKALFRETKQIASYKRAWAE